MIAVLWANLLLTPGSLKAIIFYSTGDPEYNTTAPIGSLAGSGWELQGDWSNFLGTPIGPHHFLTAQHVGGSVGDPFLFQGARFSTIAFSDDPQSDLRIWQVAETFPVYAQLYRKTNEPGQRFVVFGRGTQRGDPVTLNGELKGWTWGIADGRQRWGENQVTNIQTTDGTDGPAGRQLLQALFDSRGGSNEADLSVGDSGGGVFIQDGTTWKLAGINYAVDGPYNTSNSGPGFDAAIFNASGLYTESGGSWTLTPLKPNPEPGAFYASRISTRLGWIKNVLQPPVQPPVLQSATAAAGPYQDETDATVDTATQTITLSLPAGTRFFRLSANSATTITAIQSGAQGLTFRYTPAATP